MPMPMRSRGEAEVAGMKKLQGAGRRRGREVAEPTREYRAGGVSVLRSSFGVGILVISGQSRMMYQRLEPKAGGDNLIQEVEPQGSDSAPHDTTHYQYGRTR